MIDERKVLQHSKSTCYTGIVFGCAFSLVFWDSAILVFGVLFSLTAIARHFDLKRFIRDELKKQIN